MSIIDSIKNLFSGVQNKLPDNLNSVDELRAKGQELAAEHGDAVNKAVDTVQERIPGEKGDSFIDATQEKFTQLGGTDKQ